MSEHGATMPKIQKQSRHKSLDILQGYTQLSEKHAKDSYLKTIPSFKSQEPAKNIKADTPHSTTDLLVDKLIRGEISEETFKLALQTLTNNKQDKQNRYDMGYFR